MTAHSSAIQNFESGQYVDTCLRPLNNSEFCWCECNLFSKSRIVSGNLTFWPNIPPEGRSQGSMSFILRFARLPLVAIQPVLPVALGIIWSEWELCYWFQLSKYRTKYREENSRNVLTLMHVLLVVFDLEGAVFSDPRSFWEFQKWNIGWFWVCRSVLSLSSTH